MFNTTISKIDLLYEQEVDHVERTTQDQEKIEPLLEERSDIVNSIKKYRDDCLLHNKLNKTLGWYIRIYFQ